MITAQSTNDKMILPSVSFIDQEINFNVHPDSAVAGNAEKPPSKSVIEKSN
jgi:hypothetical protein